MFEIIILISDNTRDVPDSSTVGKISILKDPKFLSAAFILPFLWKNKSVILFPLDVVLDGFQCKNHFDNDNVIWGSLTLIFMLLPNIMRFYQILYDTQGKRNKKDISYAFMNLLFLPFITYRK